MGRPASLGHRDGSTPRPRGQKLWAFESRALAIEEEWKMATPVGLLAGKGDKQEEPWPNKSASPPTTMLLTQNFFRSFFFVSAFWS